MKRKHISFDFWGTLFKGNPEYSAARNKAIKSIILTSLKDDIDYKLKSTKSRCDMISEITGTHISWEQCMGMICTTLIKDDRGMIHDDSPQFDKEIFQNKLKLYRENDDQLVLDYSPLLIDADTKEILKELVAKGYTLSILSNTSLIPGYVLSKILDRCGLGQYFKFEMYSDEYKMSKPNIKIFQEMVKLSGVKPEEILHVGDNAFADGGCINAGVEFYHINTQIHNIQTLHEYLLTS